MKKILVMILAVSSISEISLGGACTREAPKIPVFGFSTALTACLSELSGASLKSSSANYDRKWIDFNASQGALQILNSETEAEVRNTIESDSSLGAALRLLANEGFPGNVYEASEKILGLKSKY